MKSHVACWKVWNQTRLTILESITLTNIPNWLSKRYIIQKEGMQTKANRDTSIGQKRDWVATSFFAFRDFFKKAVDDLKNYHGVVSLSKQGTLRTSWCGPCMISAIRMGKDPENK